MTPSNSKGGGWAAHQAERWKHSSAGAQPDLKQQAARQNSRNPVGAEEEQASVQEGNNKTVLRGARCTQQWQEPGTYPHPPHSMCCSRTPACTQHQLAERETGPVPQAPTAAQQTRAAHRQTTICSWVAALFRGYMGAALVSQHQHCLPGKREKTNPGKQGNSSTRQQQVAGCAYPHNQRKQATRDGYSR
jgi:hypothetical protein